MKYPKAIYRIGNEFEFKEKGLTLRGNFLLDNGLDEGRYVMLAGGIHYTNKLKLVGITAETLAELARENGDDVRIDFSWFYPSEVTVYNMDKTKDKNRNNSQSFITEEDEPLGEFLLRVAKERNYIK